MEITEGQEKPERLELPIHRGKPWSYLLVGALCGAALEMLVSRPLDAVFRNLFEHIFAGDPIRLTNALAHLARPGEWPAVSLTGFIFGGALGFVFYRLKESQRRIQSLRHEFEIQVSSLRHHYKNLALGITGFSARARRKMEKLQQICDCNSADSDIQAEIAGLQRSVTILEEASQRLTSTLTEELMFLKALQSNGLTLRPQNFFPVLQHAVKELLELRFRDKAINVEINGRPLQEPGAPLAFHFEPYAMEIILQNLLSNAMRFGDFIRVKAGEQDEKVMVEIWDNGPGVNIQEIKRSLVSASGCRGAESTQLGLRVTLHLIEKCGGRLSVLNKPGGGAAFSLEFPKNPRLPVKERI